MSLTPSDQPEYPGNVTSEDMLLFLAGKATNEVKQAIAAQLEDKNSFASRWLEEFRNPPKRPEDIDPNWLSSDE